MRLKTSLRMASAIGLCAASAVSHAQSNAQAPAASGAPGAKSLKPDVATTGSDVGDIVVTAQRRTERLQDVPVSASVVSGATLQAQGHTTLEQLSESIPAVVITKGGAGDRLSIRGIGSGDNNPLFEQSVATFVDGVYRGRSRSSEAAFLDVSRVEILKGPQSVYFGNNSIAGVLNIVTADPGDKLSGYARYLYDFNFHNSTGEAAIGGPVTDNLGVRVAGLIQRGQGWLLDTDSGIRVPRVRNLAGRITTVWKPLDGLTINLKGQVERLRQNGAIADELADCPPDPRFTAGPQGACAAAIKNGDDLNPNNFRRAEDPQQLVNLDSQSLTGTVSYDVGPATFTSVTSYYHYKYLQQLDSDGSSAVLLPFTIPERYRQFSQELRVASNGDGFFQYSAGAYYQHDHLHGSVDYNYSSLSPKATGPFAALQPYLPFGQVDDYVQPSRTIGLFASATIKPTSRLEITVGGRQSWVKKDIVLDQYFGTASPVYGPVTPFPASIQTLANLFGKSLSFTGLRTADRNDQHFSPAVTLGYKLSDRINAYAKYVNGFKAGGFNGTEHTGVAGSLSYGPEYVDAFEIGLKSQFFGRRLTANIAIFHDKFHDLQVSVAQNSGAAGAILNVIANAKGAVSKGAELETRWHFDNHFSAGGSFTYLDSKYTSYANAGGASLDLQEGHAVIDLSGTRTRYAPKYSGSVDAEYRAPLFGSIEFRVQPNVYFSSKYNYSNNNDVFLNQDGYAKVGALIGVSDPTRGWDFSVIGKNLTNHRINTFGVPVPQARGSYLIGAEEPWSISAQLRFDF